MAEEKHRRFVFAGGGAKGLAHMGVLATLLASKGLPKAAGFSGSSIGSFFAAIACIMAADSSKGSAGAHKAFSWLGERVQNNTLSGNIANTGENTATHKGLPRLAGHLAATVESARFMKLSDAVPHSRYAKKSSKRKGRFERGDLDSWIKRKAKSGISKFVPMKVLGMASEVITMSGMDESTAKTNFQDGLGFLTGFYYHREIIAVLAHVADLVGLKKPANEARGYTFEELYKATGKIDLAITSLNILTHKMHTFSYMTTPEFHVADAIRMSGSFPYVFRPIAIPAGEAAGYAKNSLMDEGDFQGVWIDGGASANVPIESAVNTATRKLNLPVGSDIICFRFRPQTGLYGYSAGQFVGSYLQWRFMEADETSANTSTGALARIIDLNTGKIDTFSFDVTKLFATKAKFQHYLKGVVRHLLKDAKRADTEWRAGAAHLKRLDIAL